MCDILVKFSAVAEIQSFNNGHSTDQKLNINMSSLIVHQLAMNFG